MTNWPEIEKKYFMSAFKRQPLVLVRGDRNRVWDENGKEYLDFVGDGPSILWVIAIL